MPLTLESASDSFNRTIEKIPPSSTSQQFKDGVIWADCLTLAEQDEVILIANDNAFYEASKSDRMHPQLREEAAKCRHPLRLMRDLTALLAEIRTRVDLAASDLEQAVFGQNGVTSDYLAPAGFDPGELVKFDKKLFVTEDPSKLFLDFSMDYSCPDATSKGRPPGILTISGTAFFDPKEKHFSLIDRAGDRFAFTDATGAEVVHQTRLLSAHMNIGHATVTNSTRFPLDE